MHEPWYAVTQIMNVYSALSAYAASRILGMEGGEFPQQLLGPFVVNLWQYHRDLDQLIPSLFSLG